jgi:antibiotic biosynthesis monooxygenase (ABM) superfamily enzyme
MLAATSGEERAMSERGMGIVVIQADVPAEHEAEYHRWYDIAHIPVRLGLPGFLAAARYRVTDGPAQFLTLYELRDTGALRTPEMKTAMDNPTEWDNRMTAVTQTRSQGIYKRIGAVGAPAAEHAPWLMTVGLTVAPEAEAEFNQWYDTEHLPQLGAVPGVMAARRYRRSFGDAPHYLAVYEFARPDVRIGPAWAAAAYTDWTKRMQPHLLDRRIHFGERIACMAAKTGAISAA